MTTREIRKQRKNTGGPEDFIPLFGFIGDNVFLTTDGSMGVVLKMDGAGYECLQQEVLAAKTQRFQSALRGFGEDYRVYQYVFRTSGAQIPHREYDSRVVDLAAHERIRQLEDCFTLDAYLVFVYCRHRQPVGGLEHLMYHGKIRLRKMFGNPLRAQLAYSHQEVLSNARILSKQMEDVSPMHLLPAAEAFRFFRRLLNPDPAIADMPRYQEGWTDLARRSFSQPISIEPDYFMHGKHYVQVLTMKGTPKESAANLMRPVIECPSQCVVVTEWRTQSHDAVRKLVRTKKKHMEVYANPEMAKAFASAAIGRDAKDEPKPEKSQRVAAKKLSKALSQMENEGLGYGLFAMTVIVRDTDMERLSESISHLYKAFVERDMEAYLETQGLFHQFSACIPGNDRMQGRYLVLSDENHGDWSLLFLPPGGNPRNELLNDEYLVPVATRQRTPYLLNLTYQDSPHVVVLGVNGSGKTFTANCFVTHAQKYDPVTLILDIGPSYREITRRFGGSYMEMNPANMGCTINPFCLEPTKRNLIFLYSFVKLLCETGGDYTLTDEDKRDLYERIKGLYVLEPQYRRLGKLYHWLPKLQPHLARWVRTDKMKREGQYGSIFDNETDTLSLARFQTCDFAGLDNVPELAEPLLFYVLHRSRDHVYDPELADTLKIVVADECWRFLKTPATHEYMVTAMRTWRKHKAGMWLVTQQPEHMAENNAASLMAEAMTSILLPNPYLNEEVYKSCFKLNDVQVELIKKLQPKREFLLTQPFHSVVLSLDCSEAEIGLYSSTPQRQLKEKREHEISERISGTGSTRTAA